MRKQSKRRNNGESGMLMLEAQIIYMLTMVLLFFILAVFSTLYQRWNLQTIANEATMRMAQTYRLNMAEEASGFADKDDFLSVGTYRYLANTFTKNMEESVQERITTYSNWRLSKTTYTNNVTEPKCVVEVVSDALGRRHLETTITGEYAVPFGEFLTLAGFKGTVTYEVNAYADCLDIVDYVNIVDYTKSQTSLSQLNSTVIGLIDSLFSLIDTIFTDG